MKLFKCYIEDKLDESPINLLMNEIPQINAILVLNDGGRFKIISVEYTLINRDTDGSYIQIHLPEVYVREV